MKRIDLTDFLGSESEITYDEAGATLYLKLTSEPIHYTDIQGGINVDCDKQDRVVGIEVFL